MENNNKLHSHIIYLSIDIHVNTVFPFKEYNFKQKCMTLKTLTNGDYPEEIFFSFFHLLK